MAAVTTCGVDTVRNIFTRAQYELETQFGYLEGVVGVWDGKIRNLGAFPNSSGWAKRNTTLGFNRPRVTTLRFNPMVGLQDDCRTSCDVKANTVRLGNADHVWVRMMEYAENTEAFCLISMLGEALSLDQQIRNHIRVLKTRTGEIMDEFKRSNYMAIARNKWMGVENNNSPRRALWRFAQDANGQPDTNYIILNPGIDPNNISLPTIPQLNYIVDQGTYNGAFPAAGGGTIITDWETISEIPRYDTNVRMDNRYRQPSVLNPEYPGNETKDYAGFGWMRDPTAMRYNWTTSDPSYPNGVLKRVETWTDKPVSEGCWDEVSQDYLEASFQISGFYNPNVMGLRNANIVNPTGMPFDQPQSPYNGMWRFVNEINEITPCNVDRTKAFWRMLMRMAADPIDNGEYGHIFLHRRFNNFGPQKSCRPLSVSTAGSYNCTQTCPPLDWTPPPLVVRNVCPGKYNAADGNCNT